MMLCFNVNVIRRRVPWRVIRKLTVRAALLTTCALLICAMFTHDFQTLWVSHSQGNQATGARVSAARRALTFLLGQVNRQERLLLGQEVTSGSGPAIAAPVIEPHETTSRHISQSIVEQLIARYRVDMNYRLIPGQSPWQVASDWVNSHHILLDEAPELGAVLRAMNSAQIVAAEDRGKWWQGGQMPKILLQLDGGQWAIFKPKWYERDFAYTGQNLCLIQDIHTSEIAAFHVARILGLRRTPLVVGRKVSLKKDILPVARYSLLSTVFTKPDTNETCVYGLCTMCGKTNSAYTLCVKDDAAIEGAVILMLPEAAKLNEYHESHPWLFLCHPDNVNRTLSIIQKAADYCDGLLSSPEDLVNPKIPNMFYNNTVLFMQLMDSGIFHYLVMNYDRKINVVKNDPYKDLLIMLDNGKSFAHPARDEGVIMAPVWQCCRVRRSTYERLLLLQNGTLGRVVRAVLAADPISPVLAEPQYAALDRRLNHVLHEIQRCIDTRGSHYVFRYG